MNHVLGCSPMNQLHCRDEICVGADEDCRVELVIDLSIAASTRSVMSAVLCPPFSPTVLRIAENVPGPVWDRSV